MSSCRVMDRNTCNLKQLRGEMYQTWRKTWGEAENGLGDASGS